jgi:hypothetical protein
MDVEERRQRPAMKVTTVRFGVDLWALLEGEAARAGVSVSHYVREAALARAAFAAGARAGVPGKLLADWAQAGLGATAPSPDDSGSTERLIAALTRISSAEGREDAAALRAQSQQARRQAKNVSRRRTR